MRDEHRNESLRDPFLLEGAVDRVRRITCDIPLIGSSYCSEVDVNTELKDRIA